MEAASKYVIYRLLVGGLDYVTEKTWDEWVRANPHDECREVCRVITMVEAINLTKLANSEEGESE